MPGIREDGVWKELREVHVKTLYVNDNGTIVNYPEPIWKEVAEIYQRHNGSWRLIWEPPAKFIISGTSTEINLNDGSYIVSGLNDITLISAGDFEAEVLMWGEGSDDAYGGYSYGIVAFKKGFRYRVVTGYGGGAKNSTYPNSAKGGGYAGLFEGSESSVSITQTQALLIAGGAGGGGTSTFTGGGGGGSTAGGGTDASATIPGGLAATQLSGPGGAFTGQSSGDGSAGGEATYTSFGSYTWTCPAGVTSVSVVCIGGGCSGAGGLYSPNRAIGGGGAGLIYANNVPVTPGTNYTVFVGRGGQAPSGIAFGAQNHNFIAGQVSYFRRDSSNNIQANGASSSSGAGASRTGFSGATSVARSGGSGSGGIINDDGTGYGGLGGGAADYNTNGQSGRGIWGGSHTYAGTGIYGLNPGNYGGGGGGSDYTWSPGKSGQNGAVRIIWGSNTSFPSQAQEIPPKYSGGGAGYYGGGCGILVGSAASGSGGGSGFVKSSVLDPKITTSLNNTEDPDRGGAGDINYGPARVVIRLPA